MKEKYFTEDNIVVEALRMLSELQIRSGLPPRSLNGAALLILDMQRYFLDRGSRAFIPSADAITPRIIALRDAFLSAGLPVILTKHVNTEADAGMMAVHWKDIIRKESHISEIIPGLHCEGTEVLEKSQYDAFYNTELERTLKDRGVSELVITGVMTHLCCETTLRSAFVRGFAVHFPADATAAYNRAFHLASLRNIAHGFVAPGLAEDILSCFQG